MKNLLFLLLSGFLLWSCQQQGPVRYAEEGPEIDAVMRMVDAYETQNFAVYDELYADTVKIYHNSEEPMSLSDMKTKDKEGAEMWTDIDVDIEEAQIVVTDEGYKWVDTWGTWSARHKASGLEFSLPMQMSARFEDGKITREVGYWNEVPIVMGLMEWEQESSEANAEEDGSEDM